MSYTYLLDLYTALDERISCLERQRQAPSASPEQTAYHQGRVDSLLAFKSYLQDNYHQKLPRRIQKMIDLS